MFAYALTIFIGAFLLFQVQPLIGKYILPWFGGGPGVWTTCMLFFQVVLVGGYAYAHLLTRWFRPRAQAIIHLGVLAAAVLLLPITPSEHWKPRGEADPTLQILLLLAATLGLPYLVLATTGPLIQHWVSRARPGASPYRLYALSNLGSLLALLSYPFFFETHLTRREQARGWGWGLVTYAVACGFCAYRVWMTGRQGTVAAEAPWSAAESAPGQSAEIRLAPMLWVLLPACASVLLLATTNKLCQDVAVIPFLWVAPLAIYLLSFVIAFDSPRWYLRPVYTAGLAAAAAAVCWALFHGAGWPLWKQLSVYCGGLFVCCMVCHGELYRLRPAPERLTGFYLLVAAGGALGGFLVAVVAPAVFTSYYELHWGLFGCAALLALVWSLQRKGWPGEWRPLACSMLWVGAAALGVVLWMHARRTDPDIVFTGRNFYGVLTLYEHGRNEPEAHHLLLQHGRITHGLQFVSEERAAWPTTYYGPDSGVGLALAAAHPRRVGLVGLGAGTLASYAHAGDYVRIYEINPQVKELATTRFSFLRRCAGKVEVALGDARLSMEREAPQRFDVLALDAFSSDAIPMHLLTKEAFEIYERHLNTNGVIAVHISNHFLDLEPVVMNLARHFHYRQALIDYDETNEEWWDYSSTWILLTHDEGLITLPAICAAAGVASTRTKNVPLWTDDFASLFQILK